MQDTITHYAPEARRAHFQAAVDATKPRLELVPGAPPIVGTPQQEAFWDVILTGKTHLSLSALAGTGKSFSICHAARLALGKWPNLRVGFCAFNRTIADELKAKIPAQCEADTFHAFGKSALISHLGRQPDLQSDKTRIILKEMLLPDELDARRRVPKKLGKAVSDVVSMCKSYLLDGSAADVDFIVERHDIELSPNRAACKGIAPTAAQIAADAAFKARVYELVPRVLERSRELVSTIDFDDMIWLPIVLDLPVPSFQLLFCDESQDLNKARQELVFRMCPGKGRIAVVGDVNQAIYAFTGADAHSMSTMAARMDATPRGFSDLPLTQTRRCPKKVVALAREIVPSFEALPDAPDGIVDHVSAKDAATQMQPNDMVLCRCNAPLVKLAHQLLRMEKKALLRGKDLSKPILELMDALGETDVKAMGDALKSYRAVEVDRLTDANKSAQVITAFEDKCETLEVLMEGCLNRAQIEIKIKRIFEEKDPDGAVILSSVHSSKGLEADTIWILRPDLMPHPAALKKNRPDDIAQEQNLKYVALTRSKNRLIFIDEAKSEEKAVASHVPTTFADEFAAEALRQSEAAFAEMKAAPPLTVAELEAQEVAPHLKPFSLPSQSNEDLPVLEIKQSWRDDARAQLAALYRAAPFDAPEEYIDSLQAALAALPR